MSHPHQDFNLNIQQSCGSSPAPEKAKFPSSRPHRKPNASEQRQRHSKMAHICLPVHPNSFAAMLPHQALHSPVETADSSSCWAQASLYTICYFKLSQVQHAWGAAGWGFTTSVPLTLLVCGLPFCHTNLSFWDTKKSLATVCFLPFPSSSWRTQDLGTHFRRNIWPYWEKQSTL